LLSSGRTSPMALRELMTVLRDGPDPQNLP
jgi:hypothetical protein